MAETKKREKPDYGDFFINLRDTSEKGKEGGQGTTKLKFAWKGNKKSYPDEIAKELGVTAAKDDEPGLVFGVNRPRPARVYINVKKDGGGGGASNSTAKGGKKKSNNRAYVVFCDPVRLPALLIKNVLRGKSYRGGKITSCTLPKTSTNPRRAKKNSKKPNQRRRTTR